MKITLIFVGKTIKPFLIEGEKEFDNRLKHYIKIEEIVIPELKNVSKLSIEEIKIKEGELILSKIQSTDTVILLDDKGVSYSSEEFSNWIEQHQIRATKNLVMIVGGAYGFSKFVYERAQQKLSLSRMTFSHQMIRLILKEQIYRAYTIIKGEPYHHK
jgi:23S rRNA (pseudouridine1915-N3)-methyltransferase